MRLVAEILDRLVVEQGVDGLGPCLVVVVVHRAPDAHPHVGEPQGKAQIRADRDEGQQRETPVEHRPQDAGDHDHLDQRRHHVEHRQPQHGLDALRAAVDDARQPPRLPVQMEPQRQRVQVLEDLQRHLPRRALLHGSKHRVAQFPKSLGGDAQAAVRDDQCDRNHQRRVAFRRERINRTAIHDGHIDRGALGQDQEHRGHDDPHPRPRIVPGPKIWQERSDRLECVARPGRRPRDSGHNGRHGGECGVD